MKIPFKFRGLALLGLLFLILPWTAWHFALGDTLGVWRDCRTLRRKTAQIPEQPSADGTNPTLVPGLLLDGSLMAKLQPVAAENGVLIRDYKPLITLQHESVEVHTAAITLSGPYAGILQVVHYLETGIPACKPVSLQIVSVISPDRRSRRTEASLYVEQLVNGDKS